MVTREELNKLGENPYEEWQEKWLSDYGLDGKLRWEAKKEGKSYIINCNEDWFAKPSELKYMKDERFLQAIQNQYPDLNVTRVSKRKWWTRNEDSYNYIKISWK